MARPCGTSGPTVSGLVGLCLARACAGRPGCSSIGLKSQVVEGKKAVVEKNKAKKANHLQ